MGAPSQAISGFGTLYQHNYSGSFVTVAEVEKIGGPDLERQMIDVTNLGSPGEWEEFIAGLIKTGDMNLQINYLPGDQTQRNIQAGIIAGGKYQHKMILPDAGLTTISFSGFFRKFTPAAPKDNKLSAVVLIKPTGVVTFPT